MVAMRTSRIGIPGGQQCAAAALGDLRGGGLGDGRRRLRRAGRARRGIRLDEADSCFSEGTHAERRELFRTRVAQLERLWRGEALAIEGESGERTEIAKGETLVLTFE